MSKRFSVTFVEKVAYVMEIDAENATEAARIGAAKVKDDTFNVDCPERVCAYVRAIEDGGDYEEACVGLDD